MRTIALNRLMGTYSIANIVLVSLGVLFPGGSAWGACF
jgi:hypothetical protein